MATVNEIIEKLTETAHVTELASAASIEGSVKLRAFVALEPCTLTYVVSRDNDYNVVFESDNLYDAVSAFVDAKHELKWRVA